LGSRGRKDAENRVLRRIIGPKRKEGRREQGAEGSRGRKDFKKRLREISE
jgi:hypothetical protein